MAELTVKGVATKEVVCDLVQYSFSFEKDGKSIAEAVKQLDEELEKFLTVFQNEGIEPSMFTMGSTSSDKKYRYDSDEDENPYEAKRSIYLSMKLEAATTNAILQIIADEFVDVEFRESHSVSNVEGIHKELLHLAMEDSKRKAEMIAECAGKKVLGIVKVDANYQDHEEMEIQERERGICYMRKMPRKADVLMADTQEFSESVEVIWLLES